MAEMTLAQRLREAAAAAIITDETDALLEEAAAEIERLSKFESAATEALTWSFRELKVMLDKNETIGASLDRLTQRAEAVSAANERVEQALRGEKIG